jgi:glycosyltransferase involved in cell wall biosynthesis
MDYTIIIPTYNEESIIGKNLNNINRLLYGKNFEIIIVDNGSTDKTIDILKNYKIKILIESNRTVAGLRNKGVAYARGAILIFLDADVIITTSWVDELMLKAKFIRESRIVTGSRCGINNNPSWIEEKWFLPMLKEKPKYINSGHLIISKKSFIEIGGFDENLITAEDYDFSLRAVQKGFKLVNNPKLTVIHEGYPKNIIDFIRREYWHGTQDFKKFNYFIQSNTAIISLIYICLPIMGLLMSVIFKHLLPVLLSITGSMALALFGTIYRKKRYPLEIIPVFYLFNFYLLARGSVLFKIFFEKLRNNKKGRKGWRQS